MLTVVRTNRFVVAAGRAAEISAGAVSRPRISQKRMFRGVSSDCKKWIFIQEIAWRQKDFHPRNGVSRCYLG
jgi:hypothetical protein